jgi:molybdenum cofactor biosynthesis enzyme
MKMVWGMVKKALNEDQLRKISLSDKKKLKPEDFETINPSQI